MLAQNVCSRVDPFEVALSRRALENTQHVFTYKVESEGKPLTNQKNSGRCWIFAALNSIRIPFMKHYNLDEFEFSQTHLFYWDKIERCHYFLNNIIETAAKGEEVTGRLLSFLLRVSEAHPEFIFFFRRKKLVTILLSVYRSSIGSNMRRRSMGHDREPDQEARCDAEEMLPGNVLLGGKPTHERHPEEQAARIHQSVA